MSGMKFIFASYGACTPVIGGACQGRVQWVMESVYRSAAFVKRGRARILTFLRGSSLDRGGGRRRELSNGDRAAQALVQLRDGVPRRGAVVVPGLRRGLGLALQDEHAREVAVELRARARDELHDALRVRLLLAREALALSPTAALYTISSILTNADPLPELLSVLLGPIVPQLYALGEYLRGRAAVDPTLRETAAGLLTTWAQTARTDEVVDKLWDVVYSAGAGLEWRVDDEGDLRVYER